MLSSAHSFDFFQRQQCSIFNVHRFTFCSSQSIQHTEHLLSHRQEWNIKEIKFRSGYTQRTVETVLALNGKKKRVTTHDDTSLCTKWRKTKKNQINKYSHLANQRILTRTDISNYFHLVRINMHRCIVNSSV